jgi:hypothetical protein
MPKNQKGGSILDIITRRKKLGRGRFGKVVTPNYACPNFKRTNGYVSKLVKGDVFSLENEIRILHKIKNLDKKQTYLATMETYCKTKQFGWKYNIIMKNFGKDLIKTRKLSPAHLFDIFLKQLLSGLIILHKNKIYHRDVAHRNIIYNKDDNKYRFIDFGWGLDNFIINNAFHLFRRGDGLNEVIKQPKEIERIRDMYYNKKDDQKIKDYIIKNKDKLIKHVHEFQAFLDILSIFEIAKILTTEKNAEILEKKINNKVIRMLINQKYKYSAKEIFELLY